MIGTKLYTRRDQVYLFLVLYAVMAVAGGLFMAQSFSRNQTPSSASGFMVIFGTGMCVMTLIKSRQPQVSVHEDFLEVKQSRVRQLIRYRNIVAIARPDKKRLVVTLHEDRARKEITVWLKELEQSEIDRLTEFLSQKKGKSG